MNIEQTIRDYLPQVAHMSLATSKNNRPWVCEVHFAFDKDLNLYFRSLPARRHSQEIAENPHVAGNIVTQHFLDQTVRGVYFEGLATKITTDHERQLAYDALDARFHHGERMLQEAEQPEGAQFYCIKVTSFYLFDGYVSKPSQKYQLKWRGAKAPAH